MAPCDKSDKTLWRLTLEREAERKRSMVRIPREKPPRIREKLWAENPHCYWCGRLTVLATVLPGCGTDRLLATVDHVQTALANRRDESVPDGTPPLVLSCYECNHQRGCTPFVEFANFKKRERNREITQKQQREAAALYD